MECSAKPGRELLTADSCVILVHATDRVSAGAVARLAIAARQPTVPVAVAAMLSASKVRPRVLRSNRNAEVEHAIGRTVCRHGCARTMTGRDRVSQ